MSELNTKVIANWQPINIDFSNTSVENRNNLGNQFELFLKFLGYTYIILQSVNHISNWDGRELGWHQDCDGENGRFINWSNINPTEIEFVNTKKLLETNDGDIILIDNLEVKHRTPLVVDKNRWLIRTGWIK